MSVVTARNASGTIVTHASRALPALMAGLTLPEGLTLAIDVDPVNLA